MTRTVYIRESARRDLLSIQDWYNYSRGGLGDVFAEAFYARVGLIADRPELFAVISANIHATTLSRFPYIIFYCADSTTLDIIAVLHSSRDPDTWRLRI